VAACCRPRPVKTLCRSAKVGSAALLGQLNGERGDAVGLVIFSNSVEWMVPLGRLEDTADRIGLAIAGLDAHGSTALLDAIIVATASTARWQEGLRAVVLITDGRDNASAVSEGEVLALTSEWSGTRVFALAYGEDADYEFLRRISESTGGAAYRGGISTIQALFSRIAYGL